MKTPFVALFALCSCASTAAIPPSLAPSSAPASAASGADNADVTGRGEGKDNWWDALPRAVWSNYSKRASSDGWFEVYDLGRAVFAIYEPGQFEEVISYLILGGERALLFDTGLGIGDMRALVRTLTDLPIVVINSHSHYDHVGGNHQFETILTVANPYTEKNRKGRSHEDVKAFVSDGWLAKPLPDGFDKETFDSQPWASSGKLVDQATIDLGGRQLLVLLTPGHAPDALCLLDRDNRMLFTGDTLYPAPLYAHVGGSDFASYAETAERLAALQSDVDWVLPGHNEPKMEPAQLGALRDAFRTIREPGTPFVRTDGAREYKFERFSLIVSDPPPWQQ